MPTPALFAEEFDFLKDVPGALWTHEAEYPPFHTDVEEPPWLFSESTPR
jgi:hypothetical protein